MLQLEEFSNNIGFVELLDCFLLVPLTGFGPSGRHKFKLSLQVDIALRHGLIIFLGLIVPTINRSYKILHLALTVMDGLDWGMVCNSVVDPFLRLQLSTMANLVRGLLRQPLHGED